MKTLRRILLAMGLATCAIASHASPITYDFNGSFSSGPLDQQSYSGYFTFDSSAVTVGSTNTALLRAMISQRCPAGADRWS